MEFWRYIGDWIWASFIFPWNVLQVLLGIATIFFGIIAAKKPDWWHYMRNITWAWKVPLIIFVVILIPSLAISSYNMYQNLLNQEGRAITQLENEINNQEHEIQILHKARTVLWNEYQPQQIDDTDYSLGTNTIINDKIFNHCMFFCNNNYIHFNNCDFVNCRASNTDFLTIPIEKMESIGTLIQYDNCVIKDCWFINANIFGDANELVNYRSNISTK